MKIFLNGAKGHMGLEVAEKCAQGYCGAELAASVDPAATTDPDAHLYPDFGQVTEKGDCIVDFSHHSATIPLLNYAVRAGLPVVLATTGQDAAELAAIKTAAEKIPVFHAANMSLGVALLIDIAKKTVAAMPDADVEIVEIHHNRKLDAPSGTALMLAEAVREVRPESRILCGRQGMSPRQKQDIGISSVRMGNVVGIHEVLISTASQTITLKHEAHSRALFAEGALTAAKYLIGKGPGLYDMQSMLNDR